MSEQKINVHTERIKSAVVAREAIPADELLGFLEACDKEFDPPLSSRTDLTAHANKISANGVVITARLEGQLVGVLTFYCNDLVTRRAFGSMVCISQNVRQGMLGSRMVREMIRLSKEAGMESLEIRTDKHRPDLVRYYHRFGFRVIDSIPRFGGFVGVRMMLQFSDSDCLKA